MRDRIKKVCFVSAAVISGGCAYAAFYRITGIGIPCLFHLITGFKCPGCGVTRMLICLLQLDIGAAFRYNAVLLCMFPFLIVFFAYWLYRYIRYGKKNNTRPMAILCFVFVTILLAWGIVRNIIDM